MRPESGGLLDSLTAVELGDVQTSSLEPTLAMSTVTQDDNNLAPTEEIPHEFITVPAREFHTATVIWLHVCLPSRLTMFTTLIILS